MCAKVCLRVESVSAHFEFKIYQSKRKEINFTIYQIKKNNFYNIIRKDFTMYQIKKNNFYNVIRKCIRVNVIIYQKKFHTVSEQVL